ncbi:hypothetical protein QYF36_012656 [Acer negundo]|nr:hypothetical protein QYF36_012656 [Acer negundo]
MVGGVAVMIDNFETADVKFDTSDDDIFPLNIKGVAGSLVVLVNWLCAWAVSYTFNFLMSWRNFPFVFWILTADHHICGKNLSLKPKERHLKKFRPGLHQCVEDNDIAEKSPKYQRDLANDSSSYSTALYNPDDLPKHLFLTFLAGRGCNTTMSSTCANCRQCFCILSFI